MLLAANGAGVAPAPPLPVSFLALKIDHDPPLDVTPMHAGENAVDALEWFGRDGRLDLALAGETQGFLQIKTRPDDRPADRDAIQHGVEDGQGKIAGRQPVERYRPA